MLSKINLKFIRS